MTAAKEKRIDRIRDVRQKQLDVCVRELAEARAHEERMIQALSEAMLRTREAVTGRQKLESGEATPSAWREAEDWLAAVRELERLAVLAKVEATSATLAAQERVKEAHGNVQRMEALLDLMKEQRRAEENRQERKQEDEFASRGANRTKSPS